MDMCFAYCDQRARLEFSCHGGLDLQFLGGFFILIVAFLR